MEKHNQNCIDNVYNLDMAKAKTDFQVNIRVNHEDLEFIDSKAKRYGMNRSQWVKYAALNAELTIAMQENLRKPKL